ncbi:MAG: archease [Chloroflexota bacterium]
MGWQEVPHTADWAVRVWADDLAGLLVESARAMNALAGIRLVEEERLTRYLTADAPDAESLLVAFLSELIFQQEQEHLAFDQFRLDIEGSKLKAVMEGAPIQKMDKAVKAVTYHNLKIEKTTRGLEAEIVLDV